MVRDLFRRLLAFLGIGRRPALKPLVSYGFTPVDHPLRATLDERYLAMRSAMAAEDGTAIAAILTSDFVSLDIDRNRIDGNAMIERVLKLDIDRSKRTAETTLLAIATSPGRATVLQFYAMASAANAPATMPRSLHTLSVDTWSDVAGTWLLARTETIQMDVITKAGLRRSRRRRPGAFPFSVNARMWEYIEPVDRGKRYVDPLGSFLAWSELGSVVGEGSQLGESRIIAYVDIAMELADGDGALDAVAARLEQAGALRGSELQYMRHGRPETRPFGTKECVALFLDGITLPAQVYAESNVDDLIANLRRVLVADKLGFPRSYWVGGKETALFFVGDDAETMLAAMRPVIDATPLCQNARVIMRYGNHPDGPRETRLPMRPVSS